MADGHVLMAAERRLISPLKCEEVRSAFTDRIEGKQGDHEDGQE